MKNTAFIFVLFCIAVLSPAVCAAELKVSAGTPDLILERAKKLGPAELEKGSTNNPRIVGRIDGQRYAILFRGCKNGQDCTAIQFFASWSTDKDIDLSVINEWNIKSRTGKAFLQLKGRPALRMDMPLPYVSASYLDKWSHGGRLE